MIDQPGIPATAEARAPALQAALAQIRAEDPAFDQDALLNEVQRRFLQVRQAMQLRYLDQVAGVVSPQLLQALKADAARQIAAGVRTEMRGLAVDGARLIWLVPGPAANRAIVALDYSAAPTGVDETTGRVVFGGDEASTTEYWTLVRAREARTPSASQTAAGCPRCGAPIAPGAGPACPFCGAALPSALLGWQLERMDQTVQWAEAPNAAEDARRQELAGDEQADSDLDGLLRAQS